MTPPEPQPQAICTAAGTRVNTVTKYGIQDPIGGFSRGQM
jgi:hypothetical protein